MLIKGDWMIKYVNGREVSGNNWVKVRSHPQATTDNFINYVQLTFRKNPNLIIIHTGTNDIQNNVNTLQKISKIISSVKEYDTDDNIKVALSSINHQSEHDFQDYVNGTNRKLENLCKGKGVVFINNSNIDSTCLNRSKLHLNISRTSPLKICVKVRVWFLKITATLTALASTEANYAWIKVELLIKNFSKLVNSIWLINEHDNDEGHNFTNSSIVLFSKVSHLTLFRMGFFGAAHK